MDRSSPPFPLPPARHHRRRRSQRRMARGGEVDQQQQPMLEQVKEYQARSRHAWATASFLSSTAASSSSRVEVLLVIWELVLFALLVFACVAFYFKFIRLAFSFTCVTALLYMCMRLTKEERKHKRSKQRMLLPLSM